jgi:hypothetical protein
MSNGNVEAARGQNRDRSLLGNQYSGALRLDCLAPSIDPLADRLGVIEAMKAEPIPVSGA